MVNTYLYLCIVFLKIRKQSNVSDTYRTVVCSLVSECILLSHDTSSSNAWGDGADHRWPPSRRYRYYQIDDGTMWNGKKYTSTENYFGFTSVKRPQSDISYFVILKNLDNSSCIYNSEKVSNSFILMLTARRSVGEWSSV